MSNDTKIRIAKCGHPYSIPVEFTAGRTRIYGECQCGPVIDFAARDLMRSIRAKAASKARWGRVLTPRVAKCGHEVVNHSGPQRRQCPDCAFSERNCPVCGVDIHGRNGHAKFCSDECRLIRFGTILTGPRNQRLCLLPECAEVFEPFCTAVMCCSERHGKMLWNRVSRANGSQANPWSERRQNAYQIRRARKRGTQSHGVVSVADLIARDGMVCGICHEPVDPDLVYPNPRSRSIDHIVPIARGGAHAPENCQLAHLRCNISKGDRVA